MRRKIKIYSRTLDQRKLRKKIIKNNNNKNNLSKILNLKTSLLPLLHKQNNRLNNKILFQHKAQDKKIINNNLLKMNSKKKMKKK
jgi:hypothetical protein